MPLRHWVAVLGSMLGAFMAVLDIQITNASLKDILGTLGATMEEGSWVTTSYLVAEIVVIPLTGWLAAVFSPRRYLLATTFAFLTASVACAWAWDLHSLIAFRVIQGFTGGAMIPMALTLVLRLLPERHHAAGFAVFGMTATFAPAIGPSIGGWLTENYGWPWIFYMNLVPGALMLAALAWGMDKEPADLSKLRHGDWAGILTVATGLGCLITLLEEGNRNDWFNSPAMTGLAVIAARHVVRRHRHRIALPRSVHRPPPVRPARVRDFLRGRHRVRPRHVWGDVCAAGLSGADPGLQCRADRPHHHVERRAPIVDDAGGRAAGETLGRAPADLGGPGAVRHQLPDERPHDPLDGARPTARPPNSSARWACRW